MIKLITGVIIVVLVIINIKLRMEIKDLNDDIDELEKENTKLRNVFRMVFFHIRAFKEGENPFTAMNKILDIFRKDL